MVGLRDLSYVCIDDIVIFGTSLIMIYELKTLFSQYFEMKDLGEADVILNIKLSKDENNGITLMQSHYVEKVLSKFGYAIHSWCWRCFIDVLQSCHLNGANNGGRTQNIRYIECQNRMAS